ncbi:EAL domain-containing protein [Vibrio europaeus]|uniref:EAL domain-containing protein n=1 Tax=Vibrio europaeus TaxID=300876 RepID=UPI0039DFBE51
MIISKENIEIALLNNEFEPYFQPILSLNTGKVVRCEVLARWVYHSDVITPSNFLTKAMSFELLEKITNQIIEKAMKYCFFWNQSHHLNGVGVSINYHYTQLVSNFYVDNLISLINDLGLSSRLVEIEVTETQVIENYFKLTSSLARLRQEGMSIALDDFGIGYSSLSTLKTLPVDTLKLDRSFIKDIENSQISRSILEAVCHMASAIGINFVVEGVETKEQLSFIESVCDSVEVQGFLCAPPLPFEEFYCFSEMINLNSLPSLSFF